MKKILTIILSILITFILLFIGYKILKNKNMNEFKSETYVNIPGEAGIDKFYPVYYWDNKEKVFFLDNNKKSCYIAKRDSVKETYYVEELYDTKFMIPEEECKKIKYVLFYKEYLYITTNDYISIYDISTKKEKKIKNKQYKILGIYHKKIYYEYNKYYYCSSLDFKDKTKIEKLPNEFEIIPQKIEFTKKAT